MPVECKDVCYPPPERLLEIANAASAMAEMLLKQWKIDGATLQENPGRLNPTPKPGNPGWDNWVARYVHDSMGAFWELFDALQTLDPGDCLEGVPPDHSVRRFAPPGDPSPHHPDAKPWEEGGIRGWPFEVRTAVMWLLEVREDWFNAFFNSHLDILPRIFTKSRTDGLLRHAQVLREAVGASKRTRSTKKDTELKTMAAITYKARHPTASEGDCAEAVEMPRTTLRQQPEWKEWVPKIEAAAASGKLPEIQAAYDKRIDKTVGYEEDDEIDLT